VGQQGVLNQLACGPRRSPEAWLVETLPLRVEHVLLD